MKTKKIISLILVLSMFFSTLGILTVNAENTENIEIENQYAELFEQKRKHIEQDPPTIMFELYDMRYMEQTYLTVLLYTDIAKTWTFEEVRLNVMNDVDRHTADSNWFASNAFYIRSPEIEEAIKGLTFMGAKDGCSYLRKCVQYFGITKEELIAANKKMQEDPRSIRELFPFLGEEKFILPFIPASGLACGGALEDYQIEAIYLEDDMVANNLLCRPEGLYLGKNRTVLSWELVNDFELYYMEVEDLANYDLTYPWVEDFLNYPRNIETLGEDNIAFLKAEREKQLANPDLIPPQTGENIIFLPVAAIALTLGVFTIVPRKKRRFE